MGEDVIDVIMQDHREVERLFEELRTSPAKRPGLVPVLTTPAHGAQPGRGGGGLPGRARRGR